MTTGRNFDEVLRVIDSLQLTANHKVATPVNWKPGEKVIIAGSVSNDQAKETYPDGWEEPRPTSGSCRSRAELGGDAARARRGGCRGAVVAGARAGRSMMRAVAPQMRCRRRRRRRSRT